jgi:hypothetical protein
MFCRISGCSGSAEAEVIVSIESGMLVLHFGHIGLNPGLRER